MRFCCSLSIYDYRVPVIFQSVRLVVKGDVSFAHYLQLMFPSQQTNYVMPQTMSDQRRWKTSLGVGWVDSSQALSERLFICIYFMIAWNLTYSFTRPSCFNKCSSNTISGDRNIRASSKFSLTASRFSM